MHRKQIVYIGFDAICGFRHLPGALSCVTSSGRVCYGIEFELPIETRYFYMTSEDP
jgi:hypothetical protein